MNRYQQLAEEIAWKIHLGERGGPTWHGIEQAIALAMEHAVDIAVTEIREGARAVEHVEVMAGKPVAAPRNMPVLGQGWTLPAGLTMGQFDDIAAEVLFDSTNILEWDDLDDEQHNCARSIACVVIDRLRRIEAARENLPPVESVPAKLYGMDAESEYEGGFRLVRLRMRNEDAAHLHDRSHLLVSWAPPAKTETPAASTAVEGDPWPEPVTPPSGDVAAIDEAIIRLNFIADQLDGDEPNAPRIAKNIRLVTDQYLSCSRDAVGKMAREVAAVTTERDALREELGAWRIERDTLRARIAELEAAPSIAGRLHSGIVALIRSCASRDGMDAATVDNIARVVETDTAIGAMVAALPARAPEETPAPSTPRYRTCPECTNFWDEDICARCGFEASKGVVADVMAIKPEGA